MQLFQRGSVRMSSVLAIYLLSLSLLIFVSCSGYSPEITRTFWQLDVLRSPSDGSLRERLTVYTRVDDKDGKEDIAQWSVRVPERELEWKRASSEWREVRRDDALWIGWSGLAMPFDETFPRGEYIVKLRDRAGESGSASFILPRKVKGLREEALDAKMFPRVQFIEEERTALMVESPYISNTLAFADKKSEIVETREIERGEKVEAAVVEDLFSRGARSVTVGAFHPRLGFALKTGPYSLPPP